VESIFTRDLDQALKGVDFVIYATAHREYQHHPELLASLGQSLRGVVDGCNLFKAESFSQAKIGYAGIGRGSAPPKEALIDQVVKAFLAMERGVANEVQATCTFLNGRYANGPFSRIDFSEVQRLAASCSTGCAIADTGPVADIGIYEGLRSQLVEIAVSAAPQS